MTDRLWMQADLPTRLARELTTPGDRGWGQAFAPELSYGRHAGPARGDARAAAVIILLCWNGDGWALPLTVRAAELRRHGGQISLPGGLIDSDETPREAAIRELDEELGVRPPLEWIGNLSPQFIYASNAWVIPCIAATESRLAWNPNPREVEQVLRMPLEELLSPQTAPLRQVERGPLRFTAPQLMVEGHSAWGATAVILGELRGRLMRLDDWGIGC